MNDRCSNPTPNAGSPGWRILYQSALFETDREKVQRHIADAERAILARVKELFFDHTDHIEEDQILDHALYCPACLAQLHYFRTQGRIDFSPYTFPLPSRNS